MNTTLELENENTTRHREELTIEKNKDGSVLLTVVEDENSGGGWYDNALFSMSSYTLSKEQVDQVIKFLSQSEEE